MDYSGRGSHVFRLWQTSSQEEALPHWTLGAEISEPDGFDPSACQTYRDIDQFLAEPDEEKFFDATKAYVATCVVSCRVAKEGSSKLQDKWSDFLGDYPTVEELEGEEVFGTIRSQMTICCGMNAAPPQPPPPGGGPGAAAAVGASGASGGGGGGGASVINVIHCQCQHLQAETLGHGQEL